MAMDCSSRVTGWLLSSSRASPCPQVTSTAVDSQMRFERAMRSLEITRQRMTEVRAACKSDFEKCLSVISVVKTHPSSAPISKIKLEERLPIEPLLEAPIRQVISTHYSETKVEEQLPVLEMPNVQQTYHDKSRGTGGRRRCMGGICRS